MKIRQCGMIFLMLLGLLLHPNQETEDNITVHPPETRWEFRVEESECILPHDSCTYETDTLAPGETKVLCAGTDGKSILRERVIVRNGAVVSREFLYQKVVAQPKDEILLVGADREIDDQPSGNDYLSLGQELNIEEGIIITPGGQELSYTQSLRVIATAYSTSRPTAVTAIGTPAREGAIAVDPSVIPYGTEMFVVSEDGEYIYGYCTAEDCGNFRGYQIDLYFDSLEECYQFGARYCTVYILG